MGYVVVQYLTVQVKESELQRLRKTVETQQVVGQKLTLVREELKQLRAFDTQIRHLAGIKQEKGEDGAAVGGGNLKVEEAIREGEMAEEQALLVDRLYEDLRRMEREVALRAESLKTLTSYLRSPQVSLHGSPPTTYRHRPCRSDGDADRRLGRWGGHILGTASGLRTGHRYHSWLRLQDFLRPQ
jgi:hypothetical protein